MRMQAAVLDAPAQPFHVREVELDEPRGGEVLVQIAASGLCGSDLKALDGLRALAPFPVILGHEAAGVVEQVGEGVERLNPGDHVVLSILPACRPARPADTGARTTAPPRPPRCAAETCSTAPAGSPRTVGG